jgi:hypothetical protein
VNSFPFRHRNVTNPHSRHIRDGIQRTGRHCAYYHSRFARPWSSRCFLRERNRNAAHDECQRQEKQLEPETIGRRHARTFYGVHCRCASENLAPEQSASVAGWALPPDCSVKFGAFCFNHAINPLRFNGTILQRNAMPPVTPVSERRLGSTRPKLTRPIALNDRAELASKTRLTTPQPK